MLEHWIASLGYVAVVVGTLVEGETVLLVAGALAQRGTLAWPAVVLAAFAGSLLGDQAWFLLGRRTGPALLQRWPSVHRKLARAQAALVRHGDGFVLGFRFVVGIRMIAPFLLGATHYPGARFLVLNVLGGAAWSVAITFLGWTLGAGVAQLLQRVGHLGELLVAALVVGVLVYAIAWRMRSAGRWPARSRDNRHLPDGTTPLR